MHSCTHCTPFFQPLMLIKKQQAALRANLNELFNNNEEMMIKEEQYKATIDMLTAKLDVNKEVRPKDKSTPSIGCIERSR